MIKDNLRAAETGSIKTSDAIDLNASGDYSVGYRNALDMNSNDRISVDKGRL